MKSSLLLYRLVRSLRLLFPFIGHSQPFPALLWQQRLTATRIALLTIAMLTINLFAQAQVTYLDTYTDGKVAGLPTQLIVDNRGNGRANSVPSPLGGTIGFSNELGNSASPSGISWGYGYSGKVYSNNQVTSITLTLPANTKAFYLLARASYQPNLSGMGGGNITASVTTEKGYSTSGTQRCYFADTEAKYIAFNIDNYVVKGKTYRVCDNPTVRPCYDSTAIESFSNISDYLKTITVTLDFPGATLYIGQFGIYQCENNQFTTSLLASNNGVLTCTNPTLKLTAPDVDFLSTGISFTGPNGPVTDNEFIRVSNRVTVSEPGTYTVTADPDAGCRRTGTLTVTEDKALPTNVTLSNDGPLSCKKTSVTLTAGSTNGVNYAFSGPNGFSRSGTDITASATTPGNYALVVTGSNGCTATVQTDVGTAPAPPADVTQSLTDLYNATGGTNWTHKDNWLSGCTPCGWYGVTCDDNGRVTKLNLTGNNLSGTLPTSLSVLTSLQSLELGANTLTGGIPTSIGSLTALQTLNLSRTQLGGAIPASLGQLIRLQNLLLNESGLTGSLPPSLGTLGQLQNLQLYTNQLGGCFPSSYTALCGRPQISFANNPNLFGGGNFAAFCTNGTGSELVVSQYPQSGNACVGSAFSFSVVAQGAGSYQWYKLGPGQGQFQQLAESGPVLRFASVSSADAGTYQVYINYSCRPGAVQSDVVTLTVPQPGTGGCAQLNTPPTATANVSQTATAGRAFSYTVNAFTDAETPNNLTYAALFGPASSGLSFEAATRVISGTPSEPGPVSVTITAKDAGGLSASTSFSINVGPRIVSSTPLRVTLTASPQTLLTSGSTVLQATASGGTVSAPPGGYTYIFSGPGDFAATQANEVTVNNLPAGVQTFTVVVSDAGTPTSQTTSATVSVTVTQANIAPMVASTLPSQSATVGQAFSYVIPASTFTDAQTPNSLSLSVSGLPQGLRFTAPATLSGTPSVSSTSTVTVTATDPGSLSASTSFFLTVRPAPVVVTPLVLTLTASPTTLPTSGSTTLSASVSGGTSPYRYSFSGPGTITQSNTSSIAQVASLPAGVQTFTVTITDATQPTGQTITKTVSVTVSAPAATAALRVLHQDADNGQLTNNAIKPNLQIENIGTTPIDYGQLTLRYWLTVENFAALSNLQVYYAQLGSNKVKMKYVGLDKPRQGALGYVEYSFNGSPDNLAPGTNSGPIQSGVAKQDYSNFNETDDYSYANTRSLTANTRITAYFDGKLVWGTEPAEVAAQQQIKAYTESRSSGANTISTYLQLRNEGNVTVDYKELKVRYYFTSEGPQPLNFYLDYAVLGNNKINSQFVRLSPALNQADTYLELSFSPSLGTFSPATSTGNIQYRVAKQDWSNFTQSNDHSNQSSMGLSENNRVVVYVSGQRVWGSEPGAGARQGNTGNDAPLRVTVLGNPVSGAEVHFEVVGAAGQPLQLQLTDLSGQPVSERVVEYAQILERQALPVGAQKAGLLLLRVSTPTQSQTVKVLKAE